MNEVYTFKVWVKSVPKSGEMINARSAGKAKSEYLRKINDVCDFKYTDLAVQKVGGIYTSPGFIANAKYRGVPDVRCGQRVAVGEGRGVIVGHNSSANFDVLFNDDSPKYPGLKLNVHPGDVTYT